MWHFLSFQILKEEITPTLSKLKEERSSYLEYQKVIRELEHLNKLYVAWQFVCAEVWRRLDLEISRCNPQIWNSENIVFNLFFVGIKSEVFERLDRNTGNNKQFKRKKN